MYTDSNFAQKKTAYFSSPVFRVSRRASTDYTDIQMNLRNLWMKKSKMSNAVNFPDTATRITDI